MKTYFEEISSSSEDEGRRSPIIFLHGIMLTSRVWRKVAPIIAKKTRRKAYLLDARNHGKSAWSDEMNFDLLTADLAEFMNEHGIQRAVLVGNSMGGRTAINFALKYPQRVEVLVVEDMTPRNLISSSFMRSAFDVLSQILSSYSPEMELEEIKRKFLAHMVSFFHPVYLDKEKIHKHAELEIVPVVKEGGVLKFDSNIDAIMSAAESNFLVQDLPQRNLVFNGPALFIYGSKGFFNIGKDKTIKLLFPNAVIKRVEGSCHCIHLDSPYEYAEILSEFILHMSNHSSKY